MSKPFYLIVFLLTLTLFLIFEAKAENGKIAGTQTSRETKTIRGIILPHHKLAQDLIVKSFEKLKDQSFNYVVIFGPNHFQPEVNSVVTSRGIPGYSFESEILNHFLKFFPDVLISEEIIAKEHSITLHLPYIGNYFPNAKIIPLTISPFAGKNDLYQKVHFLTSVLPSDTLFIASVDFAHYLDREKSLRNNQVSLETIKNFDKEVILDFKDDYMDSPLSILMLLSAMEDVKALNWETWENSHSALLEDDPSIQGTSYIIGIFKL